MVWIALLGSNDAAVLENFVEVLLALYVFYLDGSHRSLKGLPLGFHIFNHVLTLLLLFLLLLLPLLPGSSGCCRLTFFYRLFLDRQRHDHTFSDGVEIISCLAEWVELLAHLHVWPLRWLLSGPVLLHADHDLGVFFEIWRRRILHLVGRR